MAPAGEPEFLIGVIEMGFEPRSAVLSAPDERHQNVNQEGQGECGDGPDLHAGDQAKAGEERTEAERACIARVELAAQIVDEEADNGAEKG